MEFILFVVGLFVFMWIVLCNIAVAYSIYRSIRKALGMSYGPPISAIVQQAGANVKADEAIMVNNAINRRMHQTKADLG